MKWCVKLALAFHITLVRLDKQVLTESVVSFRVG